MTKLSACLDELEKTALLERLVRLAATPIKGTPNLLMKNRSSAELKTLQQGVETAWGKSVSSPLMSVMNKGLQHIPQGRLRNVAEKGAKMVADDPIGILASQMVPVPGAGPAYVALKKGLERGIDRLAPLRG